MNKRRKKKLAKTKKALNFTLVIGELLNNVPEGFDKTLTGQIKVLSKTIRSQSSYVETAKALTEQRHNGIRKKRILIRNIRSK